MIVIITYKLFTTKIYILYLYICRLRAARNTYLQRNSHHFDHKSSKFITMRYHNRTNIRSDQIYALHIVPWNALLYIYI